MLISLSWKNIWRNKTRSLIIIFAIVFGVIGGVGFIAFMNGMLFQRLEMAIGNEVSNIQVHNPHFQINKEVNDTIAGLKPFCRTLDTCKSIKAYSVRVKSVSMIKSANSSDGVMLNGVNPDKESQVTNVSKLIIQGEYLKATRRNGIVLGEKLVQKLKVKLRSKVVVTMQTSTGNITDAAYKVVGVFRTGNTTFDEHNAYVLKEDLTGIMGLTDNTAHEIAIAVNDDKISDAVVSALKKENPSDLNIQTWKEVMPELGYMTGVLDYMLYIFMTIIFLALSFGIINTMLMAVLDRLREIGMLMAIGMNKIKVFMMIMLETTMLMFTGSIIGLIISYILVQFYSKHGIDLSAFARGMSSMGFSSVIYPVIDTASYIKIVVMVAITGVLSSIVPARKALSLNPSEAIRKL